MRRRKDDDELALMRRAIACTEAMYARAREITAPGVAELEVFSQLHAAAVEVAGEPLTALGNDYRANAMGGPPRPRAAGGESSSCSTSDPPTAATTPTTAGPSPWTGARPTRSSPRGAAWWMCSRWSSARCAPARAAGRFSSQRSSDSIPTGRAASPTTSGTGSDSIRTRRPTSTPTGTTPFEEGDVFTAEPGLYAPELRAGIRLEQNYRVTATGVELLTGFPLEL